MDAPDPPPPLGRPGRTISASESSTSSLSSNAAAGGGRPSRGRTTGSSVENAADKAESRDTGRDSPANLGLSRRFSNSSSSETGHVAGGGCDESGSSSVPSRGNDTMMSFTSETRMYDRIIRPAGSEAVVAEEEEDVSLSSPPSKSPSLSTAGEDGAATEGRIPSRLGSRLSRRLRPSSLTAVTHGTMYRNNTDAKTPGQTPSSSPPPTSAFAGLGSFSSLLESEDARAAAAMMASWATLGFASSNCGGLGGSESSLSDFSSGSGAGGDDDDRAVSASERTDDGRRTSRRACRPRALWLLVGGMVVVSAIAIFAVLETRSSAQTATAASIRARETASVIGQVFREAISGSDVPGKPPSMRGTGGTDDGGGDHVRDLELLRGSVHDDISTSDQAHASGGEVGPLMPPLDAHNTANGPGDSGIFIPPQIARRYASIWEPVWAGTDVPIFWRTPRSGGSVVQKVLGHCLGLVLAGSPPTDVRRKDMKFSNEVLDTYTEQDGIKTVNVDIATDAGIERAHRLDLIRSGLADAIFTTSIYGASRLFDVNLDDYQPQEPHKKHRGRVFTLFRHPAEVAASNFYQMRKNSRTLAKMSLLEYAKSDLLADENSLVRDLTGEVAKAEIGVRHVEAAKDVMRRHVLVGLTEKMDASLERFTRYFRWGEHGESVGSERAYAEVVQCRRDVISGGDHRSEHELIEPGSEVFGVLATRNWADVELFHFAKELFTEQISLVV